jgi:hypothetical protein
MNCARIVQAIIQLASDARKEATWIRVDASRVMMHFAKSVMLMDVKNVEKRVGY